MPLSKIKYYAITTNKKELTMQTLTKTTLLLILATTLSGCTLVDNINNYLDNFGCTWVGNCTY